MSQRTEERGSAHQTAVPSAVMPPSQRRSGVNSNSDSDRRRIGAAEAQTRGPSGRISWQTWAIIAGVIGCVAVVMLTRLTNAATAATKFAWAGAFSKADAVEYPDVIGPASRHVPPTASSEPSAAPSASASSSLSPSDAALSSSLFDRSPFVPTVWRVVRTYPHDRSSFTQGLAWRGRNLLEGTGMTGHSVLRLQRLQGTGAAPSVIGEVSLPGDHFGEGICPWPPVTDEVGLARSSDDQALNECTVHQLTWKNRVLHSWQTSDLLPGRDPWAHHTTASFTSAHNEGWGLTTDGQSLIESDGSEYLHWWKSDVPSGGAVQELGRTRVVDRIRSNLPSGVRASRPTAFTSGWDQPVYRINELEYAHGWVLGNIWYDPRVAIIHPETGAVVWYLDFSDLLNQNSGHGEDCLNGLAYTTRLDVDDTITEAHSSTSGPVLTVPRPDGKDASIAAGSWGGRLWVTGKYWSRLYEIELTGLMPADLLADWSGLPTGPQNAARRAQAAQAARVKKADGSAKKGKKGS